MQPRPRSQLGDGPECPEEGEHGRTYAVRAGYWCPVSQSIFAPANGGHGIGPLIRKGGQLVPAAGQAVAP
jgi:hypothetical protein